MLISKRFFAVLKFHGLLAYLSCFIFHSFCFSQALINYQVLPSFPGTARDDASAFMANGNVYLLGGLDVNFTTQNDVWKYTPATSSWAQLANFPAIGRQYARVFYHNEKPCLIGGIGSNNLDLAECWCYQASLGHWEIFPYPGTAGRRQHVSVSVENKLFFGLGINGTTVYKDWWMYNEGTSIWEPLGDFPGLPRKESVIGAWAGSVFVGMGVNADNSAGYKDFYRFDIDARQWKKIADYPGLVCEYATAISLSDGILVLTGINEQFVFSKEVYLYKPNEDKWIRLDDYPYLAKKGVATAAQANEFYMICGVDETIVRTNDAIKGTYESTNADLLVFPNPFTDVLHLKAPYDIEYSLYNSLGALLAKDKVTAGQNDLSFPQLEQGIYFLVMKQSDGSFVKKKLIKIK